MRVLRYLCCWLAAGLGSSLLVWSVGSIFLADVLTSPRVRPFTGHIMAPIMLPICIFLLAGMVQYYLFRDFSNNNEDNVRLFAADFTAAGMLYALPTVAFFETPMLDDRFLHYFYGPQFALTFFIRNGFISCILLIAAQTVLMILFYRFSKNRWYKRKSLMAGNQNHDRPY